jgi:hypothetical protein
LAFICTHIQSALMNTYTYTHTHTHTQRERERERERETETETDTQSGREIHQKFGTVGSAESYIP